jgi:hypothetical protein
LSEPAGGPDAPGLAARSDDPLTPVFVVTAARSGSTLLRYLLDSHPEIVSPPELNLSVTMVQLGELWSSFEHSTDVDPNRPAARVLSEQARRRAREPVEALMRTAAAGAGASVYVDKSLTTVDHLSTVAQCFPDARFIFLYRYPLDMMASGLEASRWGFNAFGFVPFATSRPGNFVAALADYWIDRTAKMLAFERTCELPNARIHYELLCSEPADTLAGLFDFLGVAPDASVVERMFQSEHGRGPGDYKIDFSGSIAMDSVGRGGQLPQNILEAQETRIDELLRELGYPLLVEARRSDLSVLLGLNQSERPAGESRRIADAVLERITHLSTEPLADWHREALPFDIVIRDAAGDRTALRVAEDGTATRLESVPDGELPTVRCIGDILIQVTDGGTSFARAVRDNLIRIEANEPTDAERPQRPHRTLAAFAALLRTNR